MAEEELDDVEDELCSIGTKCSVSLLSAVSSILIVSEGGFGVSLSSLSSRFLYWHGFSLVGDLILRDIDVFSQLRLETLAAISRRNFLLRWKGCSQLKRERKSQAKPNSTIVVVLEGQDRTDEGHEGKRWWGSKGCLELGWLVKVAKVRS